MNTIIIIDNEPGDLSSLKLHLREVYPDATLLPADDRVFVDWTLVGEYLRAVLDDNSDAAVVLLDIGLTPGKRKLQIAEGVESALGLKQRHPYATFIASTQFATEVRANEYYQRTFDGLLDKQVWESSSDFEHRKEHLQRIVDTALPPAKSDSLALLRSANVQPSLSLRLFASSFGEEMLRVLLYEECRGWTELDVRSLSSGHSGTFLLQFQGRDASGVRRSIVLKIARESRELAAEERSAERFFGALGRMDRYLTRPESRIRQVEGACYLRQPSVAGGDLLSLFFGDADAGFAAVRSVVTELVDRCREATPEATAIALDSKFFLSPLDQSRFVASMGLLTIVSDELVDRKEWPGGLPAIDGIVRTAVDTVERWNQLSMLREKVPHYVQHGDCNPSNILVSGADFILVDVARLDRWPCGYDISRLAIQLRVRLPNHARAADHFSGHIGEWLRQTVAGVGIAKRSLPSADGVCAAADFCDAAFEAAVTGYGARAEWLRRAYAIGTMWDLIKVVSYIDLSVFKRLWALLEMWRLGVRLRLYPH